MQCMQHVSAVILFGQDFSRLVRRNSNRWRDDDQADAVRKVSLGNHNPFHVVGKRQYQTTMVSGGGIINVAFNLFRPPQKQFRGNFFSAMLDSKQQTCDYSSGATAQPHANRDITLHQHMTARRRRIEPLRRQSQRVQDEI